MSLRGREEVIFRGNRDLGRGSHRMIAPEALVPHQGFSFSRVSTVVKSSMHSCSLTGAFFSTYPTQSCLT